jgi:hypothetical protein
MRKPDSVFGCEGQAVVGQDSREVRKLTMQKHRFMTYQILPYLQVRFQISNTDHFQGEVNCLDYFSERRSLILSPINY